jgi:hypothetical protein
MKRYLRNWAAVAVLAATAPGYATTVSIDAGSKFTVVDSAGSGGAAEFVFDGGSAAVEYSNGTGVVGGTPTVYGGGLVDVLNIGEVKLNSLDNSVIYEPTVIIDGDPYRGRVKIDTKAASILADATTGEILELSAIGGVEQTAAYFAGVLQGGNLKVSNLRIDLGNKTVIADMEGARLVPLEVSGATTSWVPGTATTIKDLALWNITSISGPTELPLAGWLQAAQGDYTLLTQDGFKIVDTAAPDGEPRIPGPFTVEASNVFGGLKVTQAGLDYFTNSLGVVRGTTTYSRLAEVNSQPDGWGSITSTLRFSTVPEPSTYALMGLGLVGIALVPRRQQK